MPARLIIVARKARTVREKSEEKEKRSGGEDRKEHDSFAVLLYRRLRRGSGSLENKGRDEKNEVEGRSDTVDPLRFGRAEASYCALSRDRNGHNQVAETMKK
jgi:hypothetical protein